VDTIFYISNKGLYLILMLSALPVVVATGVGLFVALIQAVTHIQEQTLPFGVKLLAVCCCLFITAPWFISTMRNYAVEVLNIAFKVH